MTWLLLGIVAWLAVSLPLALLIVRTIRDADSEAGTTEASRDELYAVHVVRPDAEPR